MNYTPGAGSLAVILIDRSASMLASDVDGKTRLEEAKRQTKASLDSLRDRARLMAEEVELLEELTDGEAVELRRLLTGLVSSDAFAGLEKGSCV